MSGVIKDLMWAGVGGTLAYYISSFILVTLVTGTTTADTFTKTIVPIVLAAGVVIVIVTVAFRAS